MRNKPDLVCPTRGLSVHKEKALLALPADRNLWRCIIVAWETWCCGLAHGMKSSYDMSFRHMWCARLEQFPYIKAGQSEETHILPERLGRPHKLASDEHDAKAQVADDSHACRRSLTFSKAPTKYICGLVDALGRMLSSILFPGQFRTKRSSEGEKPIIWPSIMPSSADCNVQSVVQRLSNCLWSFTAIRDGSPRLPFTLRVVVTSKPKPIKTMR